MAGDKLFRGKNRRKVAMRMNPLEGAVTEHSHCSEQLLIKCPDMASESLQIVSSDGSGAGQNILELKGPLNIHISFSRCGARRSARDGG
jgi:hypothetical protein